jgi:hypothetical protein
VRLAALVAGIGVGVWTGTARAAADGGVADAQAADGATTPDGGSWAEPEMSAEELRDAPPPDRAAGTTAERDTSEHAWMWVPRAVLFVPRWLAEVVFAPVRGGLWVFEKYDLEDKIKSIFFNDEGTFGIYPLAFFETGFGLNAGARLVYRDVFGHGERLRLRASYGGRYRQLYALKFTTGTLFSDRVRADLRAEYEIFPKSRFFGLGNGDLGPPPGPLIDPLADETAVETRFRHDDAKATLGIEVDLPHHVLLRPSGGVVSRDFRDDADLDGQPLLTDVYDRAALAGIDDLVAVTGELEVSYDSRRPTRDYLSSAIPATGWKATGFAGPTLGTGDDPSRYWRFGGDLLRYLDVWGGDRVLVLRAYAEAVAGRDEDVPFTDWPALGGPSILRGYPRHRFRDRVATLASVEYVYPVARQASGYLFVDGGRVHPSWSEVGWDDPRVGFGGGLYLYTATSFLATLSFSSSADGGFFFNLGFDPVYDVRARTETP